LASGPPSFEALPGYDEGGSQEARHDHGHVLEEEKGELWPAHVGRLPEWKAARHSPPGVNVSKLFSLSRMIRINAHLAFTT